MVKLLFPYHLDKNRAFSLSFLAATANRSLPNINHLPTKKRKLSALTQPAGKQVVRTLKQLSNPAHPIGDMFNRKRPIIALSTGFLFPQLGLLIHKDIPDKVSIRDVYGEYAERVIKAIRRLPPERLLFTLDVNDAPGDDRYLNRLAGLRPLQEYRFLLHRPTDIAFYAAKISTIQTKNLKTKRKRRKTIERYGSSLVSAYRQHYIDFHGRKDTETVQRLRACLRAGGFIIWE